jgi:microcystin-dependent protein
MAQPIIGEIKIFAGNFAIRGWAFCNGQLMSIDQNTALFSLLGTTYGGDGQATFALPDLQSRVPVHAGGGVTINGQVAGVESVTLLSNQLPAHTHSMSASTNPVENAAASSSVSLGQLTAGLLYTETSAPDATLGPSAVGLSGSSQPHSNVQPILALTFLIALEGVYPSRN